MAVKKMVYVSSRPAARVNDLECSKEEEKEETRLALTCHQNTEYGIFVVYK